MKFLFEQALANLIIGLLEKLWNSKKSVSNLLKTSVFSSMLYWQRIFRKMLTFMKDDMVSEKVRRQRTANSTQKCSQQEIYCRNRYRENDICSNLCVEWVTPKEQTVVAAELLSDIVIRNYKVWRPYTDQFIDWIRANLQETRRNKMEPT